MDVNNGDIILLSSIKPIMTDEAFEELLVGKSSNTTIPYMRKGKPFIVRGLLTRGIERRAVNDDKEIIGGTFNSADQGALGRIFLVEGGDRATLLWQGPANQFRRNYMRIRDELVGKVPYRLYGRAAKESGMGVGELGASTAQVVPNAQEANAPLQKAASRQEYLELTEKQFEDILAKYPEIIESGLTLIGRQVNISGKFIDLLFEDKRGDTLIVELKKGTVKREHIAQLLDYEGFFVSEFNPTTRVMLIGNRIPKNLQNALDHHGIEYAFFSPLTLRDYLTEKNDRELLDSLGW
jgi:hypothetical protein